MYFPDLFSKTFFILGLQLLITFISTKVVIRYFQKLYMQGHPHVSGVNNRFGELDLNIEFNWIKPYFYTLLVVDIIVFLILLFWGRDQLSTGLPLFCLWSILTGIQLAFALIAVDENLGAKVLGITTMITFIAAWFGIYSGIDFSFMGKFLFFGLLGLLIFNLARIFFSINRNTQRIAAAFGVFLFTGYLIYDFNKLEQLSSRGVNSWPVAMDLAIDIYLDIINLFIDLLDLLSD